MALTLTVNGAVVRPIISVFVAGVRFSDGHTNDKSCSVVSFGHHAVESVVCLSLTKGRKVGMLFSTREPPCRLLLHFEGCCLLPSVAFL